MLEMDQYEMIRTGYRVYGKNISELSRITGHSRNTIKKAIRGEPWGYRERENQNYPVLNDYRKIIEMWLESDKEKPKKQRHTAHRIYNRLVEEHGYGGSESNIRRYVRKAMQQIGIELSKAFIPCDPESGSEAEIDWGNAIAKISGKEERVSYFCMRSKYSGKHFIRMYPCERQQALIDGHIRGFGYFGGVFPVLIYDNMTTAIQKVMRGRDRIEQEGFTRFKGYYNFKAVFCNPAGGNEKGGVEGLVGYARRNYMVPIPEADSLDEINEKILKQCMGYGDHRIAGREMKVNDLYEQEKAHLLALPDTDFSNEKVTDSRVDKYATVIVDKNRYSVPSGYVDFKVKVIIYVDKVEIFTGGKKIASHKRLYGNSKWGLDPDHYLDLLQQRPMAFNSARPIRQWKESWPESLHLLLERFRKSQGETKGVKDFISVLMLYRKYKVSEVNAAVELAVESGISNSEGVRHILIYAGESGQKAEPLSNWPSLPAPDISVYGQLGGVR